MIPHLLYIYFCDRFFLKIEDPNSSQYLRGLDRLSLNLEKNYFEGGQIKVNPKNKIVCLWKFFHGNYTNFQPFINNNINLRLLHCQKDIN